jgi:hypothetical protein
MPQGDPYVTTRSVADDVLRALGLGDLKGVMSLQIETPVDGVVAVTITQALPRSKVAALTSVVRKWKLVEVTEADHAGG